LSGPGDPARERRLDWAKLLRRAWAFDVLVCARCAGPMRMIGFVEDPRTARKILDHLGLPARAPPRGRAREQLGFADHADFDGVDPPLPT
jgi:hypothetical protein